MTHINGQCGPLPLHFHKPLYKAGFRRRNIRQFFLSCVFANLPFFAQTEPPLADVPVFLSGECGTYLPGEFATQSCNTTTKTSPPTTPVAYTAMNGLTLTVNDGTLLLNTTTFAVYAASSGSTTNPISIVGTNVGDIGTTGDSSHGLYALNSGTGATSTSLADGR